MGAGNSICKLCGGFLRARAWRCPSCGAKATRGAKNDATAPVGTRVQGVFAGIKSGPQAKQTPEDVFDLPLTENSFAQKLGPLSKQRRLFFYGGAGLLSLAAVLIIPVLSEGNYSPVVVQYRWLFTIVFFLSLGAGGASLYHSFSFAKVKKAIISEHLVGDMLARAFQLEDYAPQETFSEEEIAQSGLRGIHTVKGNDLFAARYRGVSFRFADVRLIAGHGRDQRKVITGQWLILDLPRELPASVIISEVERPKWRDKRPKIETGNEKFDSVFTVFGKSSALAATILQPSFIEFLLKPRSGTFFERDPKHVFFGNKQAHIGIDTWRDLFEPCRNVGDIEALKERISKEVEEIKTLLDHFLQIEALFDQEEAQETKTKEEGQTI